MIYIRKFSIVFAVLCSVLTTRADVDYSSQLTDIIGKLTSALQVLNSIDGGILPDVQDALWTISDDFNSGQIANNVTTIANFIVTTLRPTLAEYKTLLESTVSDLDEIKSNISEIGLDLSNVYNETYSIGNFVADIDRVVNDFTDKLNNLGNLAGNLSDIKDLLNNAINDGELNKEDTQQMILTVMTQMTDTADSIKEALDIITEDDVDDQINSAISSLREELQRIYRLLNQWDQGFFKYLYDIGYPQYVLDFFRIRDAPDFSTGYLTYVEQIGNTSPYSFVVWLTQQLTAHTQGLQVINDNILFIAKSLATNGQEQVMQEFEQEANDTVTSIQEQYNSVISSTAYVRKDFDLSETQIQNVRRFLGGLQGGNSYESVKVHNLDFSSFEVFGFPTQVDYKYDISQTSNFWELCRGFFTCVWLLLVLSVFLMVVRAFYYFYHTCFNAIAGNRAEGYEVKNIPLHW